jgi:hypothetical protein
VNWKKFFENSLPLHLPGEEASRLNWTIFSYFFNVDGKASSQHLDDRIPCLESLGVKPAVISSVCAKPSSTVVNYRALSIAPSGLRFELRYLKRRSKIFKIAALPLLIAILPFYLVEKVIIDLESEWSWFALAFLRGLLLCRKHRPDLIYSTGGPPSAHLAAGLLARRVKIQWIAELQDPIVFKDWKRGKAALKIYSWLERFIFANASAVVFLTEGARQRAVQRTKPNAAARTYVIYPGARLPDEPQVSCPKQNFCRFAHFGSLAGARNPEKFLEGVQILLDRSPDLIEKVRLDFYGQMDGYSGKLISRFKYREIISNLGKVPRSEAIREMRKSDVLVLIQNLDDISYETIPSKVYEYLQVKRPILGLVYQNPQLSRMLREQGHFIADADSAADIHTQLELILGKWQIADRDPVDFPDSPYTVQDAAEKLLAIWLSGR